MKKVFIIAEAGVNHNGNFEIAKKLIDIAADAGCDAVKFQTFKAENLLLKTAEKAPYQMQTTDISESQFEMIKKLELSDENHRALIKYCENKGILFLSTPFDIPSVKLLNSLGMQIFKIPSGEITDFPYLRAIGSLNKKVILSTGNSTIDEIQSAMNVITNAGTRTENITILHCTSEYPAPFSDLNLRAIKTLEKQFSVDVGYSDHTIGIEVSVAAVALGATIIEKHFTIDKNLEGPDHKASLSPNELKLLVKSVRNIELALGTNLKFPTQSEIQNQIVARKSIVASTDIEIGEYFSENNLTTKRPATGISPSKWDEIVGTRSNRKYKKDDFIYDLCFMFKN